MRGGTYKMVLVSCNKCGENLVHQGGNIYLCPTCGEFVRLVGYALAFEPASLQEAQTALAEEVAELGLEEVC